MEPLEPNDPLWNLLGRSRPVEPRGNFAQNVVRAARQTPQDRGLWAGFKSFFENSRVFSPRLAVATTCAVALCLGVFLLPSETAVVTSSLVATQPAPVEGLPLVMPEAPFESMDEVSALLALEDTSSLSDSQIHFLLY